MTKIKFLIVALSLITTTQANADYLCSSLNHDQLEVISKSTRLGDTLVILKNDLGNQFLYGNMITEGEVFTKKTVEFFDDQGQLVITEFPKNCGRAGCHPGNDLSISAELTIENETFYFRCTHANS